MSAAPVSARILSQRFAVIIPGHFLSWGLADALVRAVEQCEALRRPWEGIVTTDWQAQASLSFTVSGPVTAEEVAKHVGDIIASMDAKHI